MAVAAAPGTWLYPAYVTIMKRDANGYPAGQIADPDTPGADVTTSAYLMENITAFNPGTGEKPIVTVTGGQKTLGKVYLPENVLPEPTLIFSEVDETFESLFVKNNTLDSTTNSERQIRGMNSFQNDFVDCIVRVHVRRTARTGTTYLQWYDIFTYLNCVINQTASTEITEQSGSVTNPSNVTYTLALSTSTRDVTGLPISSLATNSTGNEEAAIIHRSLKPLQTTTYYANGVATTFTTGYRPTNTDATGAAHNNVTTNGVASAVTSIATATGLVTLTGAGSSADIIVVDGQTDWQAI